jgi:hypothetical protein
MSKRNRLLYLSAVVVVIALGLASRRYAASLPAFLAEYAGDTLWATMVFMGIAFLTPRWPTFRIAAVALAVSYSVEVSQLYHAPWIDNIRHTRVGGLILGFGFLWSDLACYTVGVTLGVVLDYVAKTEKRRTRLKK